MAGVHVLRWLPLSGTSPTELDPADITVDSFSLSNSPIQTSRDVLGQSMEAQ